MPSRNRRPTSTGDTNTHCCPAEWTSKSWATTSYRITYPNVKIYVGMDLTGSVLYLGSPSA